MTTSITSWPICKRCAKSQRPPNRWLALKGLIDMKRIKSVLSFALAAAVVTALSSDLLRAQDANALVHPTPDSWPMYHGDYSGQRHSALKQITPENVKNLTL